MSTFSLACAVFMWKEELGKSLVKWILNWNFEETLTDFNGVCSTSIYGTWPTVQSFVTTRKGADAVDLVAHRYMNTHKSE